jgi:hypothetical protein
VIHRRREWNPFTGRSFSSFNLATIILIIARNGQNARY